MKPIEAAKKFITKHFPNCHLAILAGSTVRNAATATSDLDIVVIDNALTGCYRESFVELGWPIEVFVHSEDSLKTWIDKDILRRKPSMPQMIAEGLRIRGSETDFLDWKQHSQTKLEIGPAPFSHEEDLSERYFLTDLLDDFIGSTDPIDDLFIVNQILETMVNYKMVKSGRWLVYGKRVQKALTQCDPAFSRTCFSAMQEFYQTGSKIAVIRFIESTLSEYGGRVFEGYSVGKA